MQKTLLTGVLIVGTHFGLFAQNPAAESAPFTTPVNFASERAMWDIQLDADATQIPGSIAGVCWTGTEFWLSQWSSDSLFTANAAGNVTSGFVIPGISGTRGITTDGTHLYLSNASNTIYKVNPSTKTLVSSITSAASVASRYLAYDPTLDAGNGGFWTGNFSTEWVAISMNGTVLSSIPASTHGLSGVYGLVYDPYSPGGPFLWASDQNNNATIVQLSASGIPTGLTHDPNADLGGANGVAGGAFISNSFSPGTISLGMVLQGEAILVYEIASSVGLNEFSELIIESTIYPNPSDGNFNLEFSTVSNEETLLTITDISGIIIHLATYYPLRGKNKIQITDLGLSGGCYFVSLQQGQSKQTERLIINK